MVRVGRFLLVLFAVVLLPFKGESETAQTKENILRISDELLGERYDPTPGEKLDNSALAEGNGPLTGVSYRHGSDYVVTLEFTTKGELFQVALHPEALLQNNSWSDIPDGVRLISSEMQWMIEMANKLQPVGAAKHTAVSPKGCFQSGKNYYCLDEYEFAYVYHDWRKGHAGEKILKSIFIYYTTSPAGKIDEIQAIVENETMRRSKADILRISDQLLGKRYTPVSGKPIIYDREEETGPPDSVYYRHGSAYVVELTFTKKKELVHIGLRPEALLYSDNWSDVPKGVKLSPRELRWMIETANKLQPIGTAGFAVLPPLGCLESGANIYCCDSYQLAGVSHYWREERIGEGYLKSIYISYAKPVAGRISKIRAVEEGELDLKIGSGWYRIDLEDIEGMESTVKKGASVHLITLGCTGKEKVCPAIFIDSQKK